jgi:prevent-host-death family protein
MEVLEMVKTARRTHTLKIIPALTARTQLGQILRRVRQNQERFVVDKRGEPQAVIMSVEEYLRNFARKPGALARIQREAKSKKLNLLPLREINLEIKRYRRQHRHSNA